jgi:glycosyltransferase involved in cell wall biosynthesis
MKRTRIWFVSTAWPGVGGAERVIYRLVTELDPERFEAVQVLFYELGEIGHSLADRHVPTFTGLANSRKDARLPFRLWSLAKRFPPDILFTLDNRACCFWCSIMRKSGLAPAYVVGFHTSPAVVGGLSRILMKLAVNTADRLIANSPACQKHWENLIGAAANRFDVIPNGIDTKLFCLPANKAALRRENGLPDDRPLVGSIAYLKAYKNIPLFIEVAHRILKCGHRCHFAVVGDGPERERLLADVQERGIADSFVFPGAVSNSSLWHQMCDIEMLTSLDTEAFPLTFLEANACGTPAIGTDIGGVRDLVVDGRTGYVVPSRDADALTDRLLELLLNSNKRVKMGLDARHRAVNEFSSDRMVRRYEEAFTNVVAATRGM